tara:strand:- start:303 stop:974 length:672 start_codon:yes stop_codon:yes gene_type:complete
MTNKEKLYLAKQAAGGASLDAQGLTELIALMQDQLDNPNVSPEHKANIAQNIKIYQEQLANLAPPVGTDTVLRNDGKTDVAPPSRVVTDGGKPVLESSPALSENVSNLPAEEKPLLVQEALKPNPLDEGQLAGIEAAGTPEQHSAIQAGLGAEGFEDHPAFKPVAESKPTADAGGNSGTADAGTPWYKNPYILGAGALGLGGLGAYALSGNDDEDEEEEEAYA